MLKALPSLVLVLLISCTSQNKQDTLEKGEIDYFKVQLMDLEGNKVNLSDFKDQVVFLNFWATWCKPCLAEMPSIENVLNKLSEKPIVFIAVSDEKVDKIKKFMGSKNYSFKFVQLRDDYASLEIWSLPTTLVFDRNGKVVINQIGAIEWDSDDVLEELQKLM